MSKLCRKCGGSGDVFVLKDKTGNALPHQRIENWKWYQNVKNYWQIVSIIECSLCNGFGKENV